MDMNKYDIAIIIPVYNCEKYISECLNSIIQNQSSDYGIQTIIVNDGSTDMTGNICRRYAKKYNDITYLYQKNAGVSSARNRGIELADAKYIMFVDADDSLEKNAISILLESVSDTDFLMAGYYTKSNNDKYKYFQNYNYSGDIKQFATYIEQWLSPPYLLSPWAKVFKNSIIKEHQIKFPLNMSYGEDAFFVFLYINCANKIKSINKIIYKHNLLDNSLSNSYNKSQIDNDIVINNLLYSFLEKNHINNAKDICNKRFVQNFSGNMKKLVLSDLKYKQKKEFFYQKVEKFKAKEFFINTPKKGISEKLTGLVVQKKHLFPLLYIYIIQQKLLLK